MYINNNTENMKNTKRFKVKRKPKYKKTLRDKRKVA